MRNFFVCLVCFMVWVSLASAQVDDSSERASGNGSALIIIDMQPEFITRGGNADRPENVRKVREIIERQQAMIAQAKLAGIPIVVIEYEGFSKTNPALTDALKGYQPQKTISKNTDGVFDEGGSGRKKLSEYLKKHKVGNLVITGANGGACVDSSIRGALDLDYKVHAMSQGIADFNFEDFIYPYDNNYSHYESNPLFRENDTRTIPQSNDTISEAPAPSAVVDDSDRQNSPKLNAAGSSSTPTNAPRAKNE